VLTAALLLPLALRWRILPRPYLLYVVLGVVTVLSFPPPRPLFSAPRYLMVLFPVFWLMASLLTRGKYVVAVVAFTLGFACMAALFVNWGAVG
jgi:apolipoprotein N-acyltransferase